MAVRGNSWSRSEIEELERAVSQVSSKIEKQERWKKIADLVKGRGKRECYEQYKLMKELPVKSQVGADGSDNSEDDIDNLLNLVAAGGANISSSKKTATIVKKKDSGEVFDLSSEDEDLDDLLNSIGGTSNQTSKQNRAESKDAGNMKIANNKSNTLSSSSTASGSGGGGGIRLGRGVLRTNTAAEAKRSEDSESKYGEERDSKREGSTSSSSNIHSAVISIDPSSCIPSSVKKRDLLTIDEANRLRILLFNDTKKVLPDAWKKQGLFFSEADGVKYGLVQRNGGPCGVLASVQALVLRHLQHNLNPTTKQRDTALLVGVAEMLVNASSQGEEVVVCLPTGKGDHLYRTSDYKPDGVSDDLELVTLSISGFTDDIGSVAAWLKANAMHHLTEPSGCGAVLLLFSVIFTRGLSGVKADMDEGFAGEVRTLLDRNSYMSQEGVNLLITGKAVSNVFDGERRLEDNVSGSNDVVVLQGISSRGCVGFLTLQEAYNYIEVGEHFKVPHCPTWVVYSESHYSVLFGTHPTQVAAPSGGGGKSSDKPFDLYYWDMLANQKEPIRLTVKLQHDEELPDVNDERALIPPIDLVIRTKWKGAFVDWNGTEEIL